MKQKNRLELRLSSSQVDILAKFSPYFSAREGILNLIEVFDGIDFDHEDLHSLRKFFEFISASKDSKDFEYISSYGDLSPSFLLARIPAILILLSSILGDKHLESFEEQTFEDLLTICRSDKRKYRGFSKCVTKHDLLAHIRACNLQSDDLDSDWII